MPEEARTLKDDINAQKEEILRLADGHAPRGNTSEDRGDAPRDAGSRMKALASSALSTGGLLLPEQSDQFISQVRGSSDLFNHIDLQMVDNPRSYIDSFYISDVVTKAYTEGALATETATPVMGQDEYETVEVYAAIDINHKTLTRNIMKDTFADFVVDKVIEAMGYDLAYASVQGDSSGGDPLLSAFDGLWKLSDSSHVLSANGAEVDFPIFAGAYNKFPDKKKRRLQSNLRWIAHNRLWTDWNYKLTPRADGLGAAALSASNPMVNPLGIAPLVCNEIQTNLSSTYTSATPAEHRCTVKGPFKLTATANTISLNVNGGGATVHTITAGVYRAPALKKLLNDSLIAASDPAIVDVDQVGRLVFRTSTTGVGASIIIAAPANDMLSAIGATAATYSGAAAGANTRPYGTYMWLTDPKNFWVGMLNSLRIFWEFVPRYNKWQLTVYTELVPHIMDPDAVVRVDDIMLVDYTA